MGNWGYNPTYGSYLVGIQSPSENGSGTYIPCSGRDCTPQSSSGKGIGSLGYESRGHVIGSLEYTEYLLVVTKRKETTKLVSLSKPGNTYIFFPAR